MALLHYVCLGSLLIAKGALPCVLWLVAAVYLHTIVNHLARKNCSACLADILRALLHTYTVESCSALGHSTRLLLNSWTGLQCTG